MQTISANLTAALLTIDARLDPRRPLDVYEFYPHDAVPGVDGFDPNDASETFSSVSITWNGIAYRREIKERGDIVRNMGEKTNACTLTFSNLDRYAATWAQTTQVEGLICVIRTIVPAVTDDSIVIFVGRTGKPSDIDKGEFTVQVNQDFGNVMQEIPPDKFIAEDPNGYLPGNVLYEGFRFIAINGTFSWTTREVSPSLLGSLLGRQRTVRHSEQYSSLDLTPYGEVVPEVFGRCQMQGIPIMFQDDGYWLESLHVWCKGPILSVDNVQQRDKAFYGIYDILSHTGEIGGTGAASVRGGATPHLGGNLTEDFRFPGAGLFSKTAYTGSSILQGATDGPIVITDSPVMTALIHGRDVDLPDASGVYNLTGWSDNPVHIARFILTNERFVNINPAFMEDSINYLTAQHCDEPLLDNSNGDLIAIPNAETPQAGTSFFRYPSSGRITPRLIRYNELGDTSIIPGTEDGPYTGFSQVLIPSLFAIQQILRKRYTANFPITSSVRAVDLLYKLAFICAKLFLRINKKGKYEIRSERASDATRLRAAIAVGATSVPILDVTPWKSGPELLQGRLLTGNTLTTSEVRTITSADYSTSGNSITLVASGAGGVTATASGATLTGGSTTVQASGTVTIGGSAVGTITVTIDGIVITYLLEAGETTSTAAAMLAGYINANPQLSRYIKAVWVVGSPTVVTIQCKHGALNLDSALLKAHTGPVADPLIAPTVGSSAGALEAGDYYLAYANVTASGSTAVTPTSMISLTANQKIDVSGLPAFPAGVTSRKFYLSDQSYSRYIRYVVTRTDAVNFSINVLPLPEAALPPSYNTTAEELIRVAMSFATNSQDVYPVWPASTLLVLNDIYLPSVPNGHKYQVTTAGTTGATEPTWPTSAGGTVVNGGVTFTEIGSTVLQQAGLTRSNIVKDTYKWPLGGKQSSVNQIKGKFRDAKNDFALTPFTINDRDHQDTVKKIYPLEADLQAVDNWHQANRLGNWLLSKNREGDWFNSLETGPQGLVLEEGDIICASDDSGGLINVVTRIEELRIKPNHDVSVSLARKYSTLMFSDDVGQHTIPLPSVLRYRQTVDSIVEFIDNFPIRASDAIVPGFTVAVSRDLSDTGDWRGWTLYADYGDGYKPISSGDIPAKVGTATTVLGTVTDTSVFDTVSTLDFTLLYGPPNPAPAPFSDATEAELRANPCRNLFLVGDEYIQIGTIVDNGDMTYDASDFLRGRFGTDAAELTHGASERVVFLDGSEKFVAIDPSRAGIAYNYKAVTTNQDVADATPVSFTWGGGNFTAPTPTGIIVHRDADKNSQLHIPQREDQVFKATKYWVDILAATGVTFTADASTNFLTSAAHGLVDGQEIAVANTGGALPAPLVKTKRYFVRDKTANTFKLALTVGGAAIDLTTAGTGTNKFSIIVRHMPVVPGVFNQAILESNDSVETAGSGGWLKTITSTHTNTIAGDGSVVTGLSTSGGLRNRWILGSITEPGASIEATWGSYDPKGAWDTSKNSAITVQSEDGLTNYFVMKFVGDDAYAPYGGSTYQFVSLTLTDSGSGGTDMSGELLDTRYRFQFSGSELRISRNHADSGSVLVFRSSVPPVYPVRIVLGCSQRHKFSHVTIGGLPVGLTTYPAADQVVDLGSAPATLRFRVYEEREFAGVTFLGDVTDFTT